MGAFSSEFDEFVNYEEFLALVDRHGGDFGGNEFKFQQMNSEKMASIRHGQISTESRRLIDRVK